MNGYSEHSLDEADFGPSKGISIRSFDAFPKTKPTYLTKSRSGSAWTILLIVTSVSLLISETQRWFAGTTHHTFSVEKGISQTMQLNMDIVVLMQCHDLHVNLQDASGDRIMAAEVLKKDLTQWAAWQRKWKSKKSGPGQVDYGMYNTEEEDVHNYLAAMRGTKRFAKTPRLRGAADACRIYGSLDSSKVQGDFHITARGHGYSEFGTDHLSHDTFNFTHHINELSFGPYYPSLTNPLDNTASYTDINFFKFQYYISIVPTIYTEDKAFIRNPDHIPAEDPSSPLSQTYSAVPGRRRGRTIWTNQYAVTEQSHTVGERAAPGVFVKYDIEPILLLVSEEMGSTLSLFLRLINVLAGIFVAGGWCFQLTDWAQDTYARQRKGGTANLGMLHGQDEKEKKGYQD